MKTNLRLLLSTAAASAVLPVLAADAKPEDAKKDPQLRKEIRVITTTSGERAPGSFGGPNGPGPRPMMPHVAPMEMEPVTFLGVETSPVSATLVAQLSLAEGSGLVVNQVMPKSPAAGVLKPHDILLKLDDQILIEQRQLAVLIRNHKDGDEVTLTFLRAGKQATAKVKLAKHDAPKVTMMFSHATSGGLPETLSGGGGSFELQVSPPSAWRNDEEVNRVLSMIDAGGGLKPHRMEVLRGSGAGDRSVSVTVNTGNSRIISEDESGSLELTINQGKKELVAKNAKGEQLFAGPVNTPEERKALSAEVRARLEKIEDMKQFSFKTDGDFQGAETKVIRPRGQGISLPREAAPAARPPSTWFF
jgi:hypothetical protein